MENQAIFIGAGIVLLVLFVLVSYVKCPPSVAYIISGLSKSPRVLIGRGGFRIPFFETVDRVYLGQITVDIKTETPVPTNDFINVDVDAVAKISVLPTTDGIRLAAKNFLNMSPDIISRQLQDSLQGNMREIIGTLELKKLNTDRDGFSDQVLQKATPDMAKLGIEIISCNIQNVTDREGLIYALGADNTAKIKKDASIVKAQAEKEVEINVAQAQKEANDARVISATAIAEKNNELAIKVADLKKIEDSRRAVADAAYEIEHQEQLRTINIKTVDADIEKTKREQVLSEEKIKIAENNLAAEIKKTADADKYKVAVSAEAELEQKKRQAEADRYEAEQAAAAEKAKADANLYTALKEAEGIRAKGVAEADAIKARGMAEAEAMDKKAEAYKKYGQAAVIEMMVKVLPEVAESLAKPITGIDQVNIYGTSGDSVSGMSGNIPVMMKQVMDTMSSATGIDMAEILKSGTYDAKVTKNINLNDRAKEVKDNILGE